MNFLLHNNNQVAQVFLHFEALVERKFNNYKVMKEHNLNLYDFEVWTLNSFNLECREERVSNWICLIYHTNLINFFKTLPII